MGWIVKKAILYMTNIKRLLWVIPGRVNRNSYVSTVMFIDIWFKVWELRQAIFYFSKLCRSEIAWERKDLSETCRKKKNDFKRSSKTITTLYVFFICILLIYDLIIIFANKKVLMSAFFWRNIYCQRACLNKWGTNITSHHHKPYLCI